MRKPNPRIAGFVAIVTTVGLILFCAALVKTGVPPESKDILLVVGGGLLGAFQNIVSYYFGSSEENQKPIQID